MNVLIYTGYQTESYSPNTLNHKGLGGTEQCCIYLSKYLKNFGWNIVVGGNVDEVTVDGVRWMKTETIHKEMFDQFDFIIGVGYIHFLLEFRGYNCKKIFWVHNTYYFPWWRAEELENHVELLKSPDLSKIVCLTNWHKNQWATKYNLSLDRIEVIGNAIEPDKFNKKIKKKSGKIIWSSAPERGLIELLNNWKRIKSVLGHAELHVFAPSYSTEGLKRLKRNLKDVYFRGNVSPEKLHEEMLSAEYWFYLTDYEETYCITALEMQAAGVFPITTKVAGLNETVYNGLMVENTETKWQTSIKILDKASVELKNKIIKYNKNKVKESSWLMRSLEWKKLLDSIYEN